MNCTQMIKSKEKRNPEKRVGNACRLIVVRLFAVWWLCPYDFGGNRLFFGITRRAVRPTHVVS